MDIEGCNSALDCAVIGATGCAGLSYCQEGERELHLLRHWLTFLQHVVVELREGDVQVIPFSREELLKHSHLVTEDGRRISQASVPKQCDLFSNPATLSSFVSCIRCIEVIISLKALHSLQCIRTASCNAPHVLFLSCDQNPCGDILSYSLSL
ncbi:UNVERIFIED_CONTAM: hypothetical protein K2H54_029218 [Gekko kuhli]